MEKMKPTHKRKHNGISTSGQITRDEIFSSCFAEDWSHNNRNTNEVEDLFHNEMKQNDIDNDIAT